MKHYSALIERLVKAHIAAGVVFSAVLFTAVLAGKYDSYMSMEVEDLKLMRINAVKMKNVTASMDRMMDSVDSFMPADYRVRTHRELMLLALDGIKKNLAGAQITVDGFAVDAESGSLTLPVSIDLAPGTYRSLVESVGYMQGLRFPGFIISGLRLSNDSQSGTNCRIEGFLELPAERLMRRENGGRRNGFAS